MTPPAPLVWPNLAIAEAALHAFWEAHPQLRSARQRAWAAQRGEELLLPVRLLATFVVWSMDHGYLMRAEEGN